MSDDLGPPIERLTAAPEWDEVIGGLADGQLQFPRPFDPATSEALRGNVTDGRAALTAFVDRQSDLPVMFEIQVTAVVGTVRRQLLDTRAGSLDILVALVQMLAEETKEQEHGDHGDKDR